MCHPDAEGDIRSNTAIAEWQSGYTYTIGDYCMHNGYLYRSITNGSHSGWHDEYFEIVTLKSNRDTISDFKARTFAPITGSTIDEFIINLGNQLLTTFEPLVPFNVMVDKLNTRTYIVNGFVTSAIRVYFQMSSYTANTEIYFIYYFDGIVYKNEIS